MKVYTLSTGNVDAMNESTVGVYESDTDAKEAAISAIYQIFEDEPWQVEEGYYFDAEIQEGSEDWVVSIFNDDDYEIEWWRVKEEDLK